MNDLILYHLIWCNQRTFLINLIEHLIEALFERLIPRAIKEVLGKLVAASICAGLIVFALYNLYSFAGSWLIFAMPRGGKAGWISYADDPISFVTWAVVDSLPLIIAALAIVGYFLSKRAHRRAAFREFTQGSGSRPVVRQLED
ncbi:hypothetical protein [Microvirga terricola]|uniref:Uncharacterized protein n=1 Tax=Microvirga terricola TaxID=2719797 RepID=A0ABX0V8X0_9HYPH|nr:hypothetical protein [Microvirga terricola]NIX76008.1 hypothetical protein [Microvirga terricola]